MGDQDQGALFQETDDERELRAFRERQRDESQIRARKYQSMLLLTERAAVAAGWWKFGGGACLILGWFVMPSLLFVSVTDETGAEHQVIGDASPRFWVILAASLVVGFVLFAVGGTKEKRADAARKDAQDQLAGAFESYAEARVKEQTRTRAGALEIRRLLSDGKAAPG